MLIVFGVRNKTVEGRFCQEGPACPHCGHRDYRTMGALTYFHVVWVPLIPLGRHIVAECNHCRRTRNAEEMSAPFAAALRKEILRPTGMLTTFAAPASVMAMMVAVRVVSFLRGWMLD
ncbi:MAG: hypothetical protein RL385_409 [Pseudomonadota bacterium]|jgi:phage terminase large subunit GpA-like protein